MYKCTQYYHLFATLAVTLGASAFDSRDDDDDDDAAMMQNRSDLLPPACLARRET